MSSHTLELTLRAAPAGAAAPLRRPRVPEHARASLLSFGRMVLTAALLIVGL